MASKPVILILGAGPRVGAAVVAKFASSYNIALVSRSGTGKKTPEGHLSLKADFANPDSIPPLFDAVQSEFNTAPSVVVYNAASFTPPPDKDSVLSIPVADVLSDLNVNTVGPYVAAQQAIKAWETLPGSTKKTFIYTGNILNQVVVPVPMFLDGAIGKAASAAWIGMADALYADKGYRFFYVDERFADGKLKGGAIDGPSHADFFAELVKHEGEIPWLATFAQDKGYVKF